MKAQELWEACSGVLKSECRPLEIWRIAEAAKMSEGAVIVDLIKASTRYRTVTFRYPPLPHAAITSMDEWK